jgi:GT2 family glycosyltransferase
MTLSSATIITGVSSARIESSKELKPIDVSVVVPVRDNVSGVKKLLLSSKLLTAQSFRELIIIDDGLRLPISLDEFDSEFTTFVRFVRTARIGPAGARNKGARLASGAWLLFIDSDCLFTETLLMAYQRSMNGAIGYAGYIKATGNNVLSHFYDSQRVLIPFRVDKVGIPQHIVTANALIWREAFEIIGGFDETFHLSAGEDVDLGFRLRQVGRIHYVPDAIVLHEYGDVLKFCERFYRYGRANAMLERKYSVSFCPQRQAPKNPKSINWLLSSLQYWITLAGYHREMKNYEFD